MTYTCIQNIERDLNQNTASELIEGNLLNIDPGEMSSEFWMAENRKVILQRIAGSGWLLLRGLNLFSAADFRKTILALDIPLMEEYGDLPMMASSEGINGVFNVTKYPPQKAILFHNEGAHTHSAPRYIFFQCSEAAPQGGETPLANSALVYDELPQEIRSVFAERGLLYRRNFVENLDVSWSHFFGTTKRHEVEVICAKQNVKASWTPQGSLVTETYRPAVISHPENGASLFFNQILLHHPACLDPEVRRALENMSPGGKLPRDVCFGDGTPIPDEWIAEVLRAHIRAAVSFRWQPGDIVIVDNFMVAHARRPYVGSRRHHVILARQ